MSRTIAARTGTPSLAAGVAVLAVLGVALVLQGGFDVSRWAPVAVFSLLLVAALGRWRLDGAARVACIALWAYAGWSLASVLWADSPGRAFEGAALNGFYAGLFTLPLVLLDDRVTARRLAFVVTGALGAVTIATAVAVAVSGADLFLAGRLDDPIAYRNGTAALFAAAAWPLICAAAARGLSPVTRGAALGTAAIALALAFLTQSRGVALGFAVGGLAVLALGPDRLRRAWLALAALAATALVSGSLLAPYDAFREDLPLSSGLLDDVVLSLALAGAVAFAVGLAVAIFDSGERVPGRAATKVATLALVIPLVVVAVGALVVVGNPIGFVDDKLEEFRGTEVNTTGRPRLGSTGGPRYDIWRVALDEFAQEPLLGVGEDSFGQRWFEQRRTDRNISDPHSLPLGLLAETGLIGALLFALFLVSCAAALRAGWRSADLATKRAASAMLGVALVVLGQAGVDFLWRIPVLTGIALFALGLAIALVRVPDRPPEAGTPSTWGTWTLRAVAVAATAVVTLVCLSDVHVRHARRQADPEDRVAAARTAARLNPFSVTPLYVEAGALEEQGRADEAAAALRDAADREPRNFVPLVLLGDLATRQGDRRVARRLYGRALRRNPLDPGLRTLAGR